MAPRTAPRSSANIPVRVELRDGFNAWRSIPDLGLERYGRRFVSKVLCRQFGLSEIATTFDLPDSILGVGPSSVGAGGGGTGGRTIDGYIFQGGDEPVGKIIIVRESEKFREYDVSDRNEFLRLGRH